MKPKVSLVMPTADRQKYLPVALRCFFQQSYDNKELIIIDDSKEPWYSPALQDPRVRYRWMENKMTTGAKRNLGAAVSDGEIIANLDDDDWSHPHRIEDEVNRLLKTGKSVTGYYSCLMWSEITNQMHKNDGGRPFFSSGTSQCYLRSWWKNHPFPDATFGEDSYFSREARLADELATTDCGNMIVARKHHNNTDTLRLDAYRKIDKKNWPEGFASDIVRASDTMDYIFEPHKCTPTCWRDIANQQKQDVIIYKVDHLPEILIR